MPVNLVPKFLNLKALVKLQKLIHAVNLFLKFRNVHQLQYAAK